MGLDGSGSGRVLVVLQVPYLWVTVIQRYICQDSIVIVFILEDGTFFTSLIPYN